jgi:predicted metal-binding membrane protein
VTTRALSLRRVTPQSAGLLALAALAWTVTALQARRMGVMPGTMGLGPAAFVAMWTPMMAAMMLPAVAPLAAIYARAVRARRPARLTAFCAGYLVVWAATAVPAYLLALGAGRLADGHPTGATVAASAAFAACGLYQLSPLKRRCLRHCRSPFGLLLRYGAYRGTLRDLRAGAHHAAFCVGCCWALFLLVIAVGVMNVPAMLGLAAVVVLEKLSPRGEAISRAAGVAALGLAVAVAFVPGLAPGLHEAASAMEGPAMPMAD